MASSWQSKQQRERRFLKKTKLCWNMHDCEHLPRCDFAHSLMELRNPPRDWDQTEGHYWEPGMPKPTPKVKSLIQQYLQQDQDEGLAIPQWAKQLQEDWSRSWEDAPPGRWEDTPKGRSSEEAPAPWRTRSPPQRLRAAAGRLRRPSRSLSSSSWEDALEGHPGFGSRSPSRLSRRRHLHGRSPRASSSPLEAEPKRRKLSHEPVEQSEPPTPSSETEMPKPEEYPSSTGTESEAHFVREAKPTVVSCVQAIIGWKPASLGTPNIGIARLTLRATDLVIGLCGVEELTKASNRNILSGMVAILCGGGRWTTGLNRLLPGVILRDLSRYTTFQGSHNGVMPKLDQCYEETFKALIQDFTDIWRALSRKPEPELVFFLQGWAAPVLCTPDCLPNVGRPCA